jgi:hypothetical protein
MYKYKRFIIGISNVLFKVGVIFLVVQCTLMAVSGCSTNKAGLNSGTSAASTANNLQQLGNVSARFFGLVTFEGYGQILTNPSVFAVPPITIEWMGLIFEGKLERAGAGSNISYQVHGSVSADGKWVESMFFSRQIVDSTGASGDFFRVTLRNIPLTDGVDSEENSISFSEKKGSDVQRFLVKIEYNNGAGDKAGMKTAINSLTYITTDWKSESCLATLNVNFATGPGIGIVSGQPPRQGMMG